jgi:hypothetical protein
VSLIPIPFPPAGDAERRDAARNRELLLRAARELVEECGADGLTMDTLAQRAVPAAVLCHRHLEMLLRAAGVTADPWLMAASLGATLEPERILHAVVVHHVAPERLAALWRELVTRVVRGA